MLSVFITIRTLWIIDARPVALLSSSRFFISNSVPTACAMMTSIFGLPFQQPTYTLFIRFFTRIPNVETCPSGIIAGNHLLRRRAIFQQYPDIFTWNNSLRTHSSSYIPLLDTAISHTEWPQKLRSLRLTAPIFKMPELVCIIFGTLQRRFVLNTYVVLNSSNMSHKVAPPGESQPPEFRFRRLLGDVENGRPSQSGQVAEQNRQQQWIERRRCPRSAWTVCWRLDMQRGAAQSLADISEWRRLLEYVLQQNGGHVKHIFKWRNDVCVVEFS